MGTLSKRPCRLCRRWFRPDPRVGVRQRACRNPPAKRPVTNKPKPGGARGIPIIHCPANPARSLSKQPPEPLRMRPPLSRFPWDLRKTSSGSKGLISLELWAHCCRVPRKTSYEAIFLNLLRIEEHFGVPRARRDTRCVLIPSKAEGMELEFHQLELRHDRLRIVRRITSAGCSARWPKSANRFRLWW